MPEVIVILRDVISKKEHKVKSNGIFPASPDNKNIALQQERYFTATGNSGTGYWRDPISHKLYEEVRKERAL